MRARLAFLSWAILSLAAPAAHAAEAQATLSASLTIISACEVETGNVLSVRCNTPYNLGLNPAAARAGLLRLTAANDFALASAASGDGAIPTLTITY